MSKAYGLVDYSMDGTVREDIGEVHTSNHPGVILRDISENDRPYCVKRNSRAMVDVYQGTGITLASSALMMKKVLKTQLHMQFLSMGDWELYQASSDPNWFRPEDPASLITQEEFDIFRRVVHDFKATLRRSKLMYVAEVAALDAGDQNDYNTLFGKCHFEITVHEYQAFLSDLIRNGPYWLENLVRAKVRNARKHE